MLRFDGKQQNSLKQLSFFFFFFFKEKQQQPLGKNMDSKKKKKITLSAFFVQHIFKYENRNYEQSE